MGQPLVIGVGGFASNVGKTTLLCELLEAFPGWEAIKTTRGHYRSCGKDPQACCVSHLLGEEPLVRSGREDTYESGKDTGRYWDAGAANVHWLIATDGQLEKGIRQVLRKVRSEGVLIEGNSFSEFVRPDCFVMVRRADSVKIKKSARGMIDKATAIYVSNLNGHDLDHAATSQPGASKAIPLFSRTSLPALIAHLRAITSGVRSELD